MASCYDAPSCPSRYPMARKGSCRHPRGSDRCSSLGIPLVVGAMLEACVQLGTLISFAPPPTSPPLR